MHILLFHFHTHKPNPVYQEIAGGLRRRGHTVWIGAPNAQGDLEWCDTDRVVAALPGPRLAGSLLLRRLSYLRFMVRVRDFVCQVKPDVVQINPGMLAWVPTLFLPPGLHCVLDIRQINEAVDSRFITRLKEQRDILVMKAYARIFFEHTCFCHVGAAQKIMGGHWFSKCTVVPVGIDPLFLDCPNPEPVFSAAHGSAAPDEKVRFIYVGALSRLRTLEHLLAAARLLHKESDRFQLDILGPDLADGYYHRLIRDWALEQVAAVRDPVPYTEVPALLRRYDVGVAYVPDRPTWHYQPTIKVLEYRAIGIPILSTDVASHREVVEDGRNGILVADSAESIADGMRRLIADPAFLQQCKANAQAMRRGLTWDEVARLYEQQVYLKLVGGTTGQRSGVTVRESQG